MIYARADGEPLETFARRVAWLNRTVEVGTENPQPVRAAWSEWLGGFPWDAWGTLTFRWSDPTHAQLDRAFSGFVTHIRNFSMTGDAPYFLGHEVGRGGRAHLHCLLGVGDMPRTALWSWWFKRYGRCEVRGYDPERGAAAYVSKYITKELGHYDVDLGRWARWASYDQPKKESPSWLRVRKKRDSAETRPSDTPSSDGQSRSTMALRLPEL